MPMVTIHGYDCPDVLGGRWVTWGARYVACILLRDDSQMLCGAKPWDGIATPFYDAACATTRCSTCYDKADEQGLLYSSAARSRLIELED